MEIHDVLTKLVEYEFLTRAETIIYERIAWRKSIREGRAINELIPTDPKARKELQLLYAEVFRTPYVLFAVPEAGKPPTMPRAITPHTIYTRDSRHMPKWARAPRRPGANVVWTDLKLH